MSKTYKFNEKPRPECRRDKDGYLQVQATPLAAPGFPLVFTFSGDPETKCHRLEWQTAGGPFMLFRGAIKVKDEHGATALETTLAGLYLREEYSGSASCEGGKRFHHQETTFTFEVELQCAVRDLRLQAELEAARLALELAPSTFIDTVRKTFAKHATKSTTAQVAQDIALIFPSSQRVLWATEASL